ncbi:hypothetical protein BASA81_003084 [Batrachochytrium salamandrivorans]|nr:hypothetical protein BASA81_003084 [Batrachochytrium salamandrivorans]
MWPWLLIAFTVVGLAAKPNFLIIHLDDVGYGDFGAYSSLVVPSVPLHKLGKTPQIDQMAEEGLLFTDYYSASCVCSPSRAGLLTGRYPIRTSIFPGVLSPESFHGLPQREVTLASWLKRTHSDYYTFAVGKWHLGHVEPFLPINHGFDKWTGLPYSHDFCPCPQSLTNTGDTMCRDSLPGCPLMNGSLIWQQPALLQDLTAYYARAVVENIDLAVQNHQPFFGYYACQHTHHPQFFHEKFRGKSKALGGRDDALGDALVEMDWAVGEILSRLRMNAELMDNTYVFLTSDNGAAHAYAKNAGSNEPLRCGKGTTWEGGMRVPLLAWGGKVRRKQLTHEFAAGMDLFPTIASLAGVGLPQDWVLDGVDLSPVLLDQQAKSPRQSIIYYALGGTADAIRLGKYKVHFRTSLWMDTNAKLFKVVESCHPNGVNSGIQSKPLVYDLELDPREQVPLPMNASTKLIISNALAALAQDSCAVIAGRSPSKRSGQCERSKHMHCIRSPSADPLPWPPAGKFKPWRQPKLACCAAGEDVVLLDDGEFTCAVRPPSGVGGCDSASTTAYCNPSFILAPHCQGGRVCQNQTTSQLECCTANEHSVHYCAKGEFQCKENNQCVTNARDCPKAKVLFTNRLCGSCRVRDDVVAVKEEDGEGDEEEEEDEERDINKANQVTSEVLLVVGVGAGSLVALLLVGLGLVQCRRACLWARSKILGPGQDLESKANLGEDSASLISQ